MFEAGLFALVTGDSGVNALIGDRLYPVQGPPDNPTKPYITYQDVTASSDYTFDLNELRTKRLQLDVWADTQLACLNVKLALRNLLSGYSGTLTDGTRVLFCERLNDLGNFDIGTRDYRAPVEYQFQISEP